MLRCPTCKGRARVLDSRPAHSAIRRRRICERCGHRWTTYETVADVSALLADFATKVDRFRVRIKAIEGELFHLNTALRAFAKSTTEGRLGAAARRKLKGAVTQRKWSGEEREALTKNYPALGPTVMAQRLGRTKRGVEMQAQKLGLKVDRKEAHRLEMNAE